jgi:hypothetical protein
MASASRADDASSSSYIGSSRVELNDEPELLDKWTNSMKQGIFGVLVLSQAPCRTRFFELHPNEYPSSLARLRDR